jgi:hypothetical protein
MEVNMTDFWKKWLNIWCLAIVTFGAILAAATFPATDGLVRALFDVIAPEPLNLSASLRFSVGLVGAVTMGWGGTLYAAFKATHMLDAAKAAPVWKAITTMAVTWYVIDSGISIATGFWLNAVSNTVFLLLYLIPVLKSGAMNAR